MLAERFRVESGQWFTHYHCAQEKMAQARGEWEGQRIKLEARRAQLVQEREVLQAERDRLAAELSVRASEREGLERERVRLEGVAAEAQERLAAFKRTRRYRLTQALAGPLDWLRGR